MPSEATSDREIYLAMVEFLRAYAERAQAGSLETLLADIELAGDGAPLDPAMWVDWLAALEVVRRPDSGAMD